MGSAAYTIALYIRLSSEDSKVGSYSIEGQKRILHKYVENMEDISAPNVLEFVDNGYSGTNFERPAVQELLELVRSGGVNCIIVKDFSRFGRNAIEIGYFMEMVFPLYHIRFISLGDEFDSNDYHGDTGGVNVAFKYLIAEFYSRDLSVKYKSAKYVKFRRGEYQSVNCPYGYRKGMDGRMEPDGEAADNVRLIFELAQAEHSAGEIVKALFERGILTPAEYKAANGSHGYDISRCRHIWHKTAVRRILEDERYTGTYIMGKREVTEVGGHRVRMKDESQWVKIPDHHPAIVSREMFEGVQDKLARVKCGAKTSHPYPLREKVFCGCCCHAMTRIRGRYFGCQYTAVDNGAPCHGLRVREAELEDMIYEVMSKQAKIILNVDDLSHAGNLEIQLAQQKESSGRVEACLERKRALYERFVLKEIGADAFKVQKAVLDGELAQLKQVHAAVTAQVERMRGDEKAKHAKMELAREVSGASGLTAGLADALIDRVYVYPDNQVEIVWKMKDFCAE
nr:recombinase family protein [uncultured Oscillibacter sp.]